MTTARFVVQAARRPASPPPGDDISGPAGSHREPPAVVSRRGPSSTGPAPGDQGGRKLPAVRIAVWQAALVVGFAGIGRGAVATVAAAVVAVVVLVASAVRVRGEWLSTLGGAHLSFVLRRRTRDGDWLPLPRGSVITSTGVIAGAEGLTVVARTARMELPHLAADAGSPELDLQLVAHLGPRQERPGAWLTITARRSPDNEPDEALRVALDNALRRLRKAERAAGRRAGDSAPTAPATGPRGFAVLSAADLRSTVIGLAHVGPSQESWNSWRSGSVTQISLRVRAARPEALVRLLSEGRGSSVTLAMRQTQAYPNEGVLRVAALSDDAAEQAISRITKLGAHLGVRLDRLDGRHGPAVLASLPTGGSL